MHGAVAAQVFGCTGAVLSVGLAAPQVWTTCRHRLVSGLSPAARWTAVAHSASWLVYGLVEHAPLQVVVNALCGTLNATVLGALLLLAPAARRREVLAPQALLALVWVALLVVCGRTGAVPVAPLAAVAGIVSTVPQLWHLLRHPDEDTSGVSRVTTGLALASGLCWASHGALLAQPAVALPSALTACAAAATLLVLRSAASPSTPAAPQATPAVALARPATEELARVFVPAPRRPVAVVQRAAA